MTGRRSKQLQPQTAETVMAPVEQVKNALKRKASTSKSPDQLLQKTAKARYSATSKDDSVSDANVASEEPGQLPTRARINASIGRLSCLPPEVMNMIIEKVNL